MEKQTVNTGASPEVVLEVSGDLRLKGWDKEEVLVKYSSAEDIDLEHLDNRVKISCRSDCSVQVPYRSRLEIIRVSGQALLKSLDGETTIKEVAGNLVLRSVGLVRVETVRGNLTAKNVSGILEIDSVYGNATVKDIQGDFSVQDDVRGNLILDDVDGNTSVSARGNVNVRLDPAPANDYRFEAHGNLIGQLPADASAVIDVPQAARMTLNLPGAEAARASAPYTFTMGEGDARVSFAAHGNVILGTKPRDWGFEGLEFEGDEDFEDVAQAISEQVEEQIQAQMEMLEQTLESQLSSISTMFSESGLSAEKAERVAERARAASERAQEKMRRAQEKLQRKLEAARRRAERRARTAAAKAARDRRKRPETYEWSPPEARPGASAVSEEERLMVLQMLEEGKISIEEAEQLLAALEGKEV